MTRDDRKAYHHASYLANKELHKKQMRAWWDSLSPSELAKQKELKRAYDLARRIRLGDAIKKAAQRYRDTHKEEIAARRSLPENRAKKNAQAKLFRETHRELLSRRHGAWRIANKAKIRADYLKRLYGLSTSEYLQILETQGNACAICRTTAWGVKGPSVDHDHGPSRQVRGILCQKCNRAIGLFKDNPTAMRAAASYVEQFTPKGK